ncbi:MAG TPA: UbiA family prenyltransferase [Phycisphaerales bacterium]|nr:UbiA family prenyltransferase [Phycisphaerales bacterium]
MSAIKRYVELARLSNAPTVITNVLVGTAIGGASLTADWLTILALTVAILLLYIAGMALNDAMDAEVDRRERPHRPIPSGRVSVQAAYRVACLSMAGGIAIAAVFGFASGILASALVIAIVLYNALHRRFGGAVVFMGLCRGLVYLTVATALEGNWTINWATAVPIAGAMTVYVMLLTLIARSEAAAPPTAFSPLPLRLAIMMIAAALAPALWIVPTGAWGWTPSIVAAMAAVLALVAAQRFLLSRPSQLKPAVMAMLAAICLVDAYFLTLLDQPGLAIAAAACWAATTLAHRRIAGT